VTQATLDDAFADAFLRLARSVLPAPTLARPVAVRAATLLARTVLEHALSARLARDLPGAEQGSWRAQLLCLRALDDRLGEDAAQLHGELSRACHHHPYELTPTADEAATLLDRTTDVVTRLAP
jgi:hypothetical protein